MTEDKRSSKQGLVVKEWSIHRVVLCERDITGKTRTVKKLEFATRQLADDYAARFNSNPRGAKPGVYRYAVVS